MTILAYRNISRSPLTLTAFLLSWVYWVYLAATSQMLFVQDAAGYEALGRLILSDGWKQYFLDGPNREPLYPALVALAMAAAGLLHISWPTAVIIFQLLILLLTQILLFAALKKFKVRESINAATLLYFGFSPAILNAGLSLFSEIVALPLIFGVIWTGTGFLAALRKQGVPAGKLVLTGLALGAAFFVLLLAKAVVELLAPLFLALLILRGRIDSPTGFYRRLVIMLLGFGLTFYVPLAAYKSLNLALNGSFAFTNRAASALYGNTVRRVTAKESVHLSAALAYVPGDENCRRFFKSGQCDYWSALKSDEFSRAKEKDLAANAVSSAARDKAMVTSTVKMTMAHPGRVAVFSFIEGLKIFFWETPNIGFVVYPQPVARIYQAPAIRIGLIYLLAIMSFGSFVAGFRVIRQLRGTDADLLFCILVLISGWILLQAPFFILPRYALPVASLFLVLIALAADQLRAHK